MQCMIMNMRLFPHTYIVCDPRQVLRLLYSPYVTNLYAHYESPSGHR